MKTLCDMMDEIEEAIGTSADNDLQKLFEVAAEVFLDTPCSECVNHKRRE
jgi:hypothetical protein